MTQVTYDSLPEDAIRLRTELMGATTELVPGADGSSSSRLQMQSAHYMQAPQIVGCEPRNFFTGSEFEYAKYAFNVTVMNNCRVTKIISRYLPGEYGYGKPLETYVFVENENDFMIDVIHIPAYMSNHQYFGYDLLITNIGQRLVPGQVLRQGTVLADVESNIDNEFCLGMNANVVLVSHPQVIEDALIIRRSYADKNLSYGYHTYTINVAPDEYLLLPHKDNKGNLIPIPPIGYKIGDDGIVAAKRKFNPLLAGIEMTDTGLTDIDGHFDDVEFADPGAEVIDVKVWQGNLSNNPGPFEQRIPEAVVNSNLQFDKAISDYYKQLKQENRKPKLSPACRVLFLHHAVAMFPEQYNLQRDEINRFKQFGYEMLQDYRIEITVKFPVPLDVSGKITDSFGGKGIVGKVEEDEDMMHGEDGTPIDVVMSDNAVLRRTNFNRPLEHYVTAACMTVRRFNLEEVDQVFAFIKGVSSMWHDAIVETHPTADAKRAFVDELYHNPLRIWYPHERPETIIETVRFIYHNFPPKEQRLRIKNPVTGEWELTEQKIIIGQLYMIRLDKTGRDFSAVSACRFQQFGTIAKRHSKDKHSRPISESAKKHSGESEMRHEAAYIGEQVIAEIMDRSNSPVVQDVQIESVMTAAVPMNIPDTVPRDQYPLGHHNGLTIFHHVINAGGAEFTTEE